MKTYLLFLLILSLLVLISWCIKEGDIIDCSEHHLITDVYKTPSGTYMIIENYSSNPVRWIGTDDNLPIKGGYYGYNDMHVYWVNLTYLNESDIGMRNACRVEP